MAPEAVPEVRQSVFQSVIRTQIGNAEEERANQRSYRIFHLPLCERWRFLLHAFRRKDRNGNHIR